jgi:hypothetical protein
VRAVSNPPSGRFEFCPFAASEDPFDLERTRLERMPFQFLEKVEARTGHFESITHII